MGERMEILITCALALACLVVAVTSAWPRLTVRHVPIVLEEPDVTVAITGSVAEPGSYVLPFRATVGDLVAAAGGLKPEAEPALVNMASPLVNGGSVFVPAQAAAGGGTRVSINSASIESLQELPGVGPVMARRIVEGRPYSRLEDLLRVKGIGERVLERLAGRVTL